MVVAVDELAADDAVAARLLVRDARDRDDRRVRLLVGVHELADAGLIADNDVVAQDDRERLVAHEGPLRHEDGVAKALCPRLPLRRCSC